MAEERKEWISALADGELQDGQLDRALEVLRNNRGMQASWSRYHLIRDCLHSNLEEHVAPDLHQRIAAAIEQEPVLLAPQRRTRPWLRHAAGLAVAASVTGVAVLGIQRSDAPEELGAPAATMAEVMQPQNIVRMQEPALAANTAPQGNEKLAPYLVNHNEYSVSSGMHGMLPYVRIVGHKGEQ